MSGSVFSTLSGVLTGKHPTTGLLCRETGEVLLPPCPKIHRFKHTWTYGSRNKRGYMVVGFRGKKYQVHQVIAQTFLNNPDNLPTVDHINRDKTANFRSNLRFASYETQENNRQICEDSLAKYGVRKCNSPSGYHRALLANDKELAERQRILVREWRAKQRELGRRLRKCPDGKQHWLTDEEYGNLYGTN